MTHTVKLLSEETIEYLDCGTGKMGTMTCEEAGLSPSKRDGSVSCPQTRRVITRRSEQTKWRRSPRWKRLLADHAHVPDAECVHCHRKHGQVMTDRKGNIKYDKKGNEKRVVLTINHTSRHEYYDEESYLTWSKYKEICCTTCNWMYEKGKHPCPECLKNGVVTYIRWDMEECDSCYFKRHPDILQRIEQTRTQQRKSDREFKDKRNARNRLAKRKHPCTSWRTNQKCLKGGACEHSPTKAAKNCQRGFQIKKCKVVKK